MRNFTGLAGAGGAFESKYVSKIIVAPGTVLIDYLRKFFAVGHRILSAENFLPGISIPKGLYTSWSAGQETRPWRFMTGSTNAGKKATLKSMKCCKFFLVTIFV